MHALIEHARTFRKSAAERGVDLARLATGQHPQALFITCSDSRVIPFLFTGAAPGDLLELRTAGNIVPRYNPTATRGVAASIEFAVGVLDVPDVVVCGHSHCGAVQARLQPDSIAEQPMLRRWLDQAGDQPSARSRGEQAVRHHLLAQLAHLRGYPAVAEAEARGRLRLHAWQYLVETGEVFTWNRDSETFGPL